MSISNGEMNLMEIIWENSPINSGVLVTLAFEKLGWKKSTVYTVLRKLVQKGIIKSEDAMITPIRSRNEIISEKSGELIEQCCNGSLPLFLTAFLQNEKLTKSQAEEIKKLIDDFTEE